jgi:hypothetical protein
VEPLQDFQLKIGLTQLPETARLIAIPTPLDAAGRLSDARIRPISNSQRSAAISSTSLLQSNSNPSPPESRALLPLPLHRPIREGQHHTAVKLQDPVNVVPLILFCVLQNLPKRINQLTHFLFSINLLRSFLRCFPHRLYFLNAELIKRL